MLTYFEQVLYGLLSGITEILPVSSSAHSKLALKLLGGNTVHGLPMLLIHLGILLSIYTLNLPFLMKMFRARRLALIPKKKRKRPLDVHSLLDLHFWYTLMVPIVLALIFYGRISSLSVSMPVLAVLMFLNGIVLYVPQFFRSSNKDSRTLTRAEGLFMGAGGALGVIPGMSLMAGSLSAGSLIGVESGYAQVMGQLLELIWMVGMVLYDIADMVTYGIGVLTLQGLLIYILSALAAFVAVRVSVKLLKGLSSSIGYQGFALYCWGVALFIFILNLLA